MRRLLSRTCMYGSTLLHKFFIAPPIFPSEEQKKRSQPTATRIMDHHLTFLQLLELPCAPLPPSPLHKDYLNSLWRTWLPVPSKTLDRGAINLEGGASAPLASTPPKSALVCGWLHLYLEYGKHPNSYVTYLNRIEHCFFQVDNVWCVATGDQPNRNQVSQI